ncbi:MAG: porphobilinogen deaminase [Conexibacter sp.]|nr:porphobilinogen deaminase [Conexibacter sp.]
MVRIGTRGSALALVQAELVAGWLRERAGVAVEVVPVATSGDRGALPGDKSRWVKELELALLAGDVDLAVHSAKDVPGELPDGLVLAGVPARADARDALCGAPSLAALDAGAIVGTSSLRRAAELRALRPDLDVVALRGNVDTRLRKLAEGDYAAIVLGLAGLLRLGREDAVDGVLDELVPAPGQGALLLEARADDAATLAAARAIEEPTAAACLAAERALVRVLGASCHTPVGALATAAPAAGDAAFGPLTLRAFVGLPDGSAWVRDELTAATADDGAAEALGAEVGARLRAAGADELLRAAEAAGAGSVPPASTPDGVHIAS